jgi:hypothetical protein
VSALASTAYRYSLSALICDGAVRFIVLDVLFGVVILADFSARLYISRSRWRNSAIPPPGSYYFAGRGSQDHFEPPRPF